MSTGGEGGEQCLIVPALSLPTTCVSPSWRAIKRVTTRRPESADRTARRQFQATGQPVSRTQASDSMTSRLSRYEAKCVQRRCFQCRSVPLRSDREWSYPWPIYGYHSKSNWLRYNAAAESFYIMKLFAADFSSFIVEIVQKTTNLGTLSQFWGS